jgi:DNA-binding NtrC family response regulator
MAVAVDKKRNARVVVVDDDDVLVELVVGELHNRRYEAHGFCSAAEALRMIAEDDEVDLLIADLQMPEFRGTEILQAALDRRPGLLVILITAFADVDLAVAALRAGAADFVAKPFKLDALLLSIERALRERTMRREIVRLRTKLEQPAEHKVVALSEAMQRTLDQALGLARTELPILITGEPGTGKSVVARWIHEHGKLRDGPFVHVGCQVLHDSIAETELFGEGNGDGLFAEARGGTILLDELSELPLQVQSRILRMIETRRTPRVILATSRADELATERDPSLASLPATLESLGVVRVRVPPLRERIEDIPDLVQLFLARAARTLRQPTGITDPAMRWLVRTEWPDNARELAEVVERAVALTDHDTIVLDDVAAARARRPTSVAEMMRAAADRRLSLADIELGYIKSVLAQTGNNVSRAARILGIDRRTMYRKLSDAE